MKVFQIGSSIENPDKANDLDLIIVSDKPVDICLYTTADWKAFVRNSGSCHGQRIVMHPRKHEGGVLDGKIKQILGS